MHIHYIDEVISTNHYLAHLPNNDNLPEGFMVVTDFQTGGRGQAENRWESERGLNILCSTWFSFEFLEPANQFYISKAAAIACKELLSFLETSVALKWPNDIYIGDKKAGGILIENSIIGNAVSNTIVGIGLNVNQSVFGDNLPNPVSLNMITGETYNLQNLVKELQLDLIHWFNILQDRQFELIDEAYTESLYRKNGKWPFKIGEAVFEAEIKEILPSGQLVLATNDGEKTFWFKEVEFVI
ncbi:biotin--[acetyl-CoA-carboxylase] ligase [Saccharicrinis sp. FJH62]|uniref:biotin--[acetyl-CoA-carboxylase] ligase n=1 Tax=Saccharicrinis sp. FJH62 TaxID=3344657 RepID=UPI0035D48485